MSVIVHSKNQTYLKQYGEVCKKSDLLMVSLTRYFSIPENFDVLLPIVNGNSDISLRIIDWFATNYSKKYNTSYTIKGKSKGFLQQFIVYLDYKQQLKAYSKKQFDPFCRRERIAFYYMKNGENKCIHTTVGQLNFFRWAIGYKIIDYIQKNLVNIKNLPCFTLLSKFLANKKTMEIIISENDCFEIDTINDLEIASKFIR